MAAIATTTVLSSALNPSYVNENPSIVATVFDTNAGLQVAPNANPATGNVALQVVTSGPTYTTTQTKPLDANGQAFFTNLGLTAGTTVYRAVYAGDAANATSTSANLSQVCAANNVANDPNEVDTDISVDKVDNNLQHEKDLETAQRAVYASLGGYDTWGNGH